MGCVSYLISEYCSEGAISLDRGRSVRVRVSAGLEKDRIVEIEAFKSALET